METSIPTLFLAIIATSAALAVSVGSVSYRHNRDGLFFWAVALALHTLAFTLFSLRAQVGNVVSIVVGNGLLASAFAMYAEGLFQFQQRPPPRWLVWLPVIVITVTFAFLLNNSPARVVVAAVIYSAQCLIVLLALLQKRGETIGRGQHFLAAGLALLIAMLLLRVLVTMTGVVEIDSFTASNSIQAGTYLSSLVNLVMMSLGFVLMTKERADEHNHILAIQDELTGLANRRRLNEVLASEWARASRTGAPLTLVMFDVDLFKKYNDRYGHQAGDECLKRVALVLRANAQRAGDLAARYGGEEFSLILSNTDAAAAQRLAEAARAAIESLDLPHEHSPEGRVTASAGVAVMAGGCYKDVDDLIRAADAALYRAKQDGKNRVQLAREVPGSTSVGEHVPASFVRLVWHPAYECGNRTIDTQHEALFARANHLLTAIIAGRSKDEVAVIVDALIGDVARHFSDEEAIFNETDFPAAEEHKAVHRALVSRAGELVRRFQEGTLTVGELFQFLAHDVVARHLLGEDRKFFPYLVPRVAGG